MLTGLLAFQAGGFFPAPVAVAAVALAVLLVLRLTVARRPYEGWGPHAVVVLAVLAALASATLASAFWSGAPARALPEFDRVLLYGLAFALVAAFPRRPGDLSVLLRWVLAAIVAAAVAGLATRLYPDVFVAMAGRQPSRLAHPLTYWNALSVLCAIGAVLALHAASGASSPGPRCPCWSWRVTSRSRAGGSRPR